MTLRAPVAEDAAAGSAVAGGTAARLLPLLATALICATALILLLLRPLLPPDETRYLAVAWEMHQTGTLRGFIVPQLNGAVYSHKPPLLFWLINAVWAVTGVSEFAARLVAPAFGALCIPLTFVLARSLWPADPVRARLAPLMLAGSAVFLAYASTTMFDAMLTAATLAALTGVVRMRRAPSRRGWVLTGCAIGVGVLIKGPVMLLHVLPVALLMPLWAGRGDRPELRAWYGGVGLALLAALGLVALWLVPALILGGPEYRADVLWHQSAGRVVESFAHRRPWWFFLAVLPLFLFPFGWSRATIAAFAPQRLAEDGSRFCLIWAGAALAAFSLISGKQAHYLLPELPALALLLAGGLAARPQRWMARVPLVLPALLLAGLALASAVGGVALGRNGTLSVTLSGALVTLAVAALLTAAVLALRNRIGAITLAGAGTVLLVHLMVQAPLRANFDAAAVAARLPPDAPIALAALGYEGEFTFAARLTRPLAVLTTPEAREAWLAANPGGLLLASPADAPPGLTLLDEARFKRETYQFFRAGP